MINQSLIPVDPDHARDRRQQILRAAMTCFARRGFHQTTMQDITAEAQVSVGLIYRYFESKDAVISVMAHEHKHDLQRVLDRARQAPTLFEALEILFLCHCDEQPAEVQASFVADLFAESGRNPHVAALLRDVMQFLIGAVADLIAGSAEAVHAQLDPRRAAELIIDTAHGLMVRDLSDRPALSDAELAERQVKTLRTLWTLLFPGHVPPGSAAEGRP